MLMGQQSTQALMSLANSVFCTAVIHFQPHWQGVDKEAQCTFSPFTGLHTPQQHSAENHTVLTAGSRQYLSPRKMTKAGKAHSQSFCMYPQRLIQFSRQRQA